ncbi:chloramphenicol 3-O phosphotransferase [Xaviernesmea oryzae]|uniref:Chloramphenicol 3-O phosphotransferase n=2 Tax=Xaviernesmea oryzae TaxID=464029 RepID=A0A1X7ESZ0_9HYPH|nr:chloramphenicol 3-O phosphotransferase [Xaviernesmea oryzae]
MASPGWFADGMNSKREWPESRRTNMQLGKVIILNGTSSSGKSTLAKTLRSAIGEPFCYYASDQLADAGFRADKRLAPLDERARFFDGFHRAIGAFAAAGNNLLVEHIVEEADWWSQLNKILEPFDIFWVGVHAPLPEIERRERERGNRYIGEAAFHLKTHDYCSYDIEVDTSLPQEDVISSILEAWRHRSGPTRG